MTRPRPVGAARRLLGSAIVCGTYRTGPRLPRAIHPGAWWLWALGLAAAASRTTHPILLALVIAVAAFVVARRRTDAPWALAFRLYVWLGVVIVVVRVLFRIALGGGDGPTILFRLPEVELPAMFAGLRLFGAVSAEAVLGGAYDGMRLATMVICLGAANALANPKRLVYALPSALYEVGTAVAVALSMAPQLAESVQRVRRARRLRGASAASRRTAGDGLLRMRMVKAIAVPVFSDALDRSLALAAAMDSRGYGRGAGIPRARRAVTGFLVLGGLVGICVGSYGLLDSSVSPAFGMPMMLAGVVVAGAGFVVAGRRVRRTRYRPDRWRPPELAVVAAGALAAGVFLAAEAFGVTGLISAPDVSLWPAAVPLIPAAAILLAAAPAWAAPPPPSMSLSETGPVSSEEPVSAGGMRT